MRAWLGAFFLLLAACATDAPGPDILGRWTLASVDGRSIDNGGWVDFGADGEMRAAIGCTTLATRYQLIGVRLKFVAEDAAVVATARCSADDAPSSSNDFPWDSPRLIARPAVDELTLTSGVRTFRYVRALQ